MQTQQHRSGLHRIGFAAVVFRSELLEAELFLATDFPEEIDVDALRLGLGAFQQFSRRRGDKAQQDIGRLDLGALAGGELDLQRSHVVGKHGAGTESAVLFKQDIHGGGHPGWGK